MLRGVIHLERVLGKHPRRKHKDKLTLLRLVKITHLSNMIY